MKTKTYLIVSQNGNIDTRKRIPNYGSIRRNSIVVPLLIDIPDHLFDALTAPISLVVPGNLPVIAPSVVIVENVNPDDAQSAENEVN